MEIIYFIDDKLGGVTSLNYNLCRFPLDETTQTVIHILNEEQEITRAAIHYPVQKELYFSYSNKDNYYSALKRLYNLCPDSEGAMVLNYNNEMAMLDHYHVNQTTYQLVHDDYNVRLARQYSHLVDIFICHNSVVKDKLLSILPQRQNEIYYLPHGVLIPGKFRKHSSVGSPLKLLFLGRMTVSKGIFDLISISDMLRKENIPFEWTCIGNGPELSSLKEKWNKEDKVNFISPDSNETVMELCSLHDVFVLPTKFEGTPVSLLETMSAGVVPVITSLPGSIPEIVTPDIGYCLPLGNNRAFANSIIELHNDRNKLRELSVNCREKIKKEFNLEQTAKNYHLLFQRYKEFYKPKTIKKLKVGARLDQKFIPEFITRFLRSFRYAN